MNLINDDCMNVMQQYKDKHFDLAIVDPPYGKKINMNMGLRKNKKPLHKKKQWDNNRPSGLYFDELLRICKNVIIWGGNYFADMLPPSNCWIVWDKLNGGNSYSDFELAYTSFPYACRKFVYKLSGVHEGLTIQKSKRIHPTQKPVALYNWLLTNYAKPSYKILDTHLGSGSSAIAAHYYDCEFTGIEIDKEYFELAKKRIEQETLQLTLL